MNEGIATDKLWHAVR